MIKRGGLGSYYQERRVGILLSSEEGWDPIIKRGGLGSYYQEGRVGILLDPIIKRGVWDPLDKRGEGWDPIIKREGWDPINRFIYATFVCLSQASTRISSITYSGIFVIN
jgi:hypothetical protein